MSRALSFSTVPLEIRQSSWSRHSVCSSSGQLISSTWTLEATHFEFVRMLSNIVEYLFSLFSLLSYYMWVSQMYVVVHASNRRKWITISYKTNLLKRLHIHYTFTASCHIRYYVNSTNNLYALAHTYAYTTIVLGSKIVLQRCQYTNGKDWRMSLTCVFMWEIIPLNVHFLW